MHYSSRHLCAILLTLAVISPILPTAIAQDARGTIVGTVMDTSGAVIPNADVRVVNKATGVVASSKRMMPDCIRLPTLFPALIWSARS
jgi:hypothetical protein